MRNGQRVGVKHVLRVPPLQFAVVSSGGRNRFGKITLRGRGGRCWRQTSILNRRYRILNEIKEVVSVGVDPGRTARVSLSVYRKYGIFEYMLAPEGLKAGVLQVHAFSPNSLIFRKKRTKIKLKTPGHTFYLKWIAIGTHLHSIESFPGGGSWLTRAAGAVSKLVQKLTVKKFQDFCAIRLCSGQLKYISGMCRGVVGQVSNPRHSKFRFSKAGSSRKRGFRPRVRGVAMNPIDHPHGGGEGKTSGGRLPVSRWGWLTKGKKTLPVKVRKLRVKWLKKLLYGRRRKLRALKNLKKKSNK